MIRYFSIVAVLLIYANSTNAGAQYFDDKLAIERQLLNETTLEGQEVLCDLGDDQKQKVCDEIMDLFIRVKYGHEFATFDHEYPLYPKDESKIYGPGDQYKCTERVLRYDERIIKPMYWCKSKKFRNRRTSEYEMMDGFFCAGSRIPSRVYLFEPFSPGTKFVGLIGKAEKVSSVTSSSTASSSTTKSK